MENRICAYQPCSKAITGRKNKKFCNSTCRTYASHGNDYKPGIRFETKINNAKSCKIYVKKCPITGLLFVSNHPNNVFHSSVTQEQIHKYKYTPINPLILICKECFVEFKTRNSNKSGLCYECLNKKSRRICRSRRRARQRNNKHESVDPIVVFERCNWICTYCGAHTPKDNRGKLLPNSPELDHIKPLSKGGEHSYLNTTLACRRCNLLKSDKEVNNDKQYFIW